MTAPVWLDGALLFRIATPAGTNGDQMSVETRAQFIDAALSQLVALRTSAENSGTVYDSRTLRVLVEPDGPQAVLAATDAKHPTPLPILTVTGPTPNIKDGRLERLRCSGARRCRTH